jgi:hypothetical protein
MLQHIVEHDAVEMPERQQLADLFNRPLDHSIESIRRLFGRRTEFHTPDFGSTRLQRCSKSARAAADFEDRPRGSRHEVEHLGARIGIVLATFRGHIRCRSAKVELNVEREAPELTRPLAIVGIPVYKPALTALEAFSLARCASVLGLHPMTLIGPDSLDFSAYRRAVPAAAITTFDARHFRSLESYSEMLLTPMFYEAFAAYEHLLIYQLDAFVFEDRLAAWCAKPYDYIGAPWMGADGRFSGVGNGGFSLRRVTACLTVLGTQARLSPNELWSHVRRTTPNPMVRAMKYHRKLLAYLSVRNDLRSFLQRFVRRGEPEDVFWGRHAPRFHPNFRVANEDDAIHFAVEAGLEEAWPQLAGRPPFGCHRNWFLEALKRRESGQPPESDFARRVCALADVADASSVPK